MINHTKLDLFEFLDYMKRQAGNNLRIKSLKFCYIVCALQVFYSLKEKEKGGSLLLLPPSPPPRLSAKCSNQTIK